MIEIHFFQMKLVMSLPDLLVFDHAIFCLLLFSFFIFVIFICLPYYFFTFSFNVRQVLPNFGVYQGYKALLNLKFLFVV